MLTAWNSDLSRQLDLAAGADEHLTKPFAAAEVMGRVKSLLAAANPRPPVPGAV